jgi:hypothetical protein
MKSCNPARSGAGSNDAGEPSRPRGYSLFPPAPVGCYSGFDCWQTKDLAYAKPLADDRSANTSVLFV